MVFLRGGCVGAFFFFFTFLMRVGLCFRVGYVSVWGAFPCRVGAFLSFCVGCGIFFFFF